MGLRGGAIDSGVALKPGAESKRRWGAYAFRERKGRVRIAWHCLLLLAWAGANAQTRLGPDDESGKILALEKAWNQALIVKDAKAVEPLMAAELIYIEYDGTVMNKPQYLVSIKAPAQLVEHVASESMQVQFFGQIAVVVGVYLEKGIMNGKPYSHRERFVDTWIVRNGMWVCVTSQSTLIAH
jgi:uncharacterized protein DUF4440